MMFSKPEKILTLTFPGQNNSRSISVHDHRHLLRQRLNRCWDLLEQQQQQQQAVRPFTIDEESKKGFPLK